MKKSFLIFGILLILCLISGSYGYAQTLRDSTKRQRLQEVNINADAPQKVFSGPAAVQHISAQQIKELPTLQLSDAQLEKAFARITKAVRTHLQPSLDESFLPPEMTSKISTLVSERLERMKRSERA